MTKEPTISDGGEITPTINKIEPTRPLIIILVITCIFVFALGVGLGIVYFTAPKTAVAPAVQTNLPVTEPTQPKERSKLATDSAVLKIAGDIAAFQQELARIDLLEPQLAAPSLDLNIGIK